MTYKWRADNSDADLLTTNLVEKIPIRTANGVRTQSWYYPSRQDCRTCHTTLAGGVLGVKTRQLNRQFAFPSGVTDNELRAWNHAGLLEPALEEAKLPDYPSLARPDDAPRSFERTRFCVYLCDTRCGTRPNHAPGLVGDPAAPRHGADHLGLCWLVEGGFVLKVEVLVD